LRSRTIRGAERHNGPIAVSTSKTFRSPVWSVMISPAPFTRRRISAYSS
jgi:hypothetical protein